MTKMFDVVGVSRTRADQPYKLRVANGKPEARQKVLERGGHVDVMLVQVAPPVTKEQALDWLKANYPDLAAQLKVRAAKSKTDAEAVENDEAGADVEVEPAVEPAADAVPEVATEAAEPEVATEVEVTDAALSPAAKAALRRVRDAARKREKRAAAKAAAAASTEAA